MATLFDIINRVANAIGWSIIFAVCVVILATLFEIITDKWEDFR